MQPLSNCNFSYTFFVDSTTVLYASKTRRVSLEHRHITASGTVDFNMERIVVDMKLCDAPLSNMAKLCLWPIVTDSSNRFTALDAFKAYTSLHVQSRCFGIAVVPLLSFMAPAGTILHRHYHFL